MIANYMHNRQEIFIRRIRRLIQQENFQKLKNVLKKIPPEEIASNLSSFTDEEKYGIFSLLPSGIAGTVLDETDPGSGKYLIKNIEDSQLAKIISRLPDDEAVDILNELDDERSQTILSLVKETENIEKLMTYPPESAGGIMSTDFIVADEANTVRQVLTKIRKFKWKDPELFYVIYITDKDGHLQGIVALPGLLKAKPTESIGKIYKKDPIKVRTYVDQEEVAHIVSLYNLISVPVVDDDEKLVGVIYVEDVIDVINEEATEDIYKMAGANDNELLENSVIRTSRLRLPWLTATLLGSLISAMIITFFKPTLEKIIALAAFMPIIAAMGGNVGVQSSSIVIRGLATGSISFSNLWRVLIKELKVGMTIGLICGVLIGIIVGIWKSDVKLINLGLAVGIAMCSAMTVAATMGALVPILFHKISIDPAIATGPFVTTFNDITGYTIYFLVVNILMRF